MLAAAGGGGLTERLAETLRASAHWQDVTLSCEVEAEIGGTHGPSAKDILAVRLERAFAEAFPRTNLKAIRWGELARRLLEAT